MTTARSDDRLEQPQVMNAGAVAELHAALRRAGYRVIGPTVRDGAIVLAELRSAADLPYGWGVALEPSGYRLRRRADDAAFGHAAGPQSWKSSGLTRRFIGVVVQRLQATRIRLLDLYGRPEAAP